LGRHLRDEAYAFRSLPNLTTTSVALRRHQPSVIHLAQRAQRELTDRASHAVRFPSGDISVEVFLMIPGLPHPAFSTPELSQPFSVSLLRHLLCLVSYRSHLWGSKSGAIVLSRSASQVGLSRRKDPSATAKPEHARTSPVREGQCRHCAKTQSDCPRITATPNPHLFTHLPTPTSRDSGRRVVSVEVNLHQRHTQLSDNVTCLSCSTDNTIDGENDCHSPATSHTPHTL
jgi:hypothetical protein